MRAVQLGSLFSGVGAFEEALQDLGIPYDLAYFCEIDKYAAQSYCQAHNVDPGLNIGDITKVDPAKLPKELDLITYGFPCQDISIAGYGKGFTHEGKQTRSGLFYNAMDIIEETEPHIAIAENVKNLVSKKFKEEFNIVLASLELAGYENNWKVLNSCDYEIPQNRERVFIISLQGGSSQRNELFYFGNPKPLTLRLGDVLEEQVEEKYYLSKKQMKSLLTSTFNQERARAHKKNDIVGTLLASDPQHTKCVIEHG